MIFVGRFIILHGPTFLTQLGEPRTKWDWYFLMEHYGLPTRSLDWTESVLVALYFALRKTKDKKEPPADWLLNPMALDRDLAGKGYEILSTSLNKRKTTKHLPEMDSSLSIPRYPIAIEPALKSFRIAAQQGVFTLHGKSI